MNTHKLLVLGGVAVVALAAALWSTGTRTPVQESAPSQALVPGLEAKLNDVTTVRVRGPGDAVLATLVKGGEGWTLQERGYPADVDKLRTFLVKLAQARRVEQTTANPALYDRLGVEPLDTPEAQGAQVELEGIDPPVKLLVGHNVPRGSGSYVRFADQPASWEINTDLAVERNPANWLLRDLTDIASGRIERVEVKPAQGPAVKIVRAAPGGAGDFLLEAVPKGREPASDFIADGTAAMLSGLRFDDLVAGDAAPAATAATISTFVTNDGLTVTATTWQAGEKTYARFAVALDEAKADAAKTLADQARAANGTRPAAETPAAPDPRAEAKTLAARFENRVFVLPPYKADLLSKPLEGYLKPKA